MNVIIACLLNVKIVKLAETDVVRERLCKRLSSRYVISTRDTQATKEEWLEAEFSVQSVPSYITRTSFRYERVLLRQLEKYEVGVRWPPACEDVSSEAGERPLLEDFAKQRSEDRDWEHK
jgi:hypothetical protein